MKKSKQCTKTPKKNKGSELPPSFVETLRAYELLETALCFLMRNRIAPSFDSVASFFEKMATDTGQVHLIRAGHESTQKLITSLLGPGAGNILDAHWVPLDPAAGPSGFRLELAFTRIGGVGAGNSKKRVKEAEKALLVKARALHATFQRAQAHWRRLGGALIGTGLFEEKGGSCAA
eukprot:CAMPEP_0172624790 /NCGR_PEP_ID=MMETSP1068-20121228/139247_1 /TAXON_ID=35684 /ORGANISM="Pseudopedinella elastica, Strain CCMP716" /LENGTH=176 /DNA_ID=CAMNT_0013433863 /DNA_START=100 /DNA_END=627 /DNA_ORIENTATION=-